MGQRPKQPHDYAAIEDHQSFLHRHIYSILRALVLVATLGFLVWYVFFDTPKSAALTSLAGVLATVVLGFLVWYLGFDPSSTVILPLTQGRPYKINYLCMAPVDWYGHFLLDGRGRVKGARGKELRDANTLVTYTGSVNISYDIENIAKFSQLNMVRMGIKVTRKPAPEVLDVLEVAPGLGGGGIRKYEIQTSYDASPDAPATQMLWARPVHNSGFDYLKLSPGESESVELAVSLSEPGMYELSPVATIRFRGAEYQHHFEALEIVIPFKARLWNATVWDALDPKPAPTLYSVERCGNELRMRGMVDPPCPEPVLFAGHPKDYFEAGTFLLHQDVLYTSCTGPQSSGTENQSRSVRLAGGELLIPPRAASETLRSYLLGLPLIESEERDGDLLHQNPLPEPLSEIVRARYGEIARIAWSPDREYAAVIACDQAGLMAPNIRAGRLLTIRQSTSKITSVPIGTGLCFDLAWSPSGKQLAILCGHLRSTTYGGTYLADNTELWSCSPNGEARLIAEIQGGAYPFWSRDETKILLGGTGLHSVDLQPPCAVESYFRTGFGCRVVHPRWISDEPQAGMGSVQGVVQSPG